MNRLPQIKVIVLMMVAVLLAGGGITVWSRNASQAAKTRFELLKTEVPDEGELKKMVLESQTVVDDYRSQLQHLEQAVPSLAYVPTLLTELELLGRQHSIEVTGVRPIVENKVVKSLDDKSSGGDVRKPAYQEMAIDITGRGSYENVMQMVEAIKKFPQIVGLRNVSILCLAAKSERMD